VSTEMVVNVSPRETRAALLENGVLQELFVERASRRGLAGNLYKGRVSRVLPGMQAAFIDIGLERTAFLHVSDIVQPADAEGAVDAPRTGQYPRAGGRGRRHPGAGAEGPARHQGRAGSPPSSPSRRATWCTCRSVTASVSRRGSRTRPSASDCARRCSRSCRPGNGGGYIVRTAAEGATGDALRADMLFLRKLWGVLTERARGAAQGTLVHEDQPLPLRLMRDLVGEGVDRVLVDNERTCEQMREFAATFMPGIEARVERYTGSRPIFDLHGVEEEIQRSLERKVALKSGGYLIIDQTEALTTIDVNTGAYVGHRNLEETIYRTNLEAAVAIARQLRLRNLGGIIIIDFIDMEEEEHRRQVLAGARERRSRRTTPRLTSRPSRSSAGRDDAQAHAREPGAPAVHAVPSLRRPRLPQDARNGLLRDLPRDPAPGRAVRPAAAAGARAPGRDRAAARRGIGGRSASSRCWWASRSACRPSHCTSPTSTTWC